MSDAMFDLLYIMEVVIRILMMISIILKVFILKH